MNKLFNVINKIRNVLGTFLLWVKPKRRNIQLPGLAFTAFQLCRTLGIKQRACQSAIFFRIFIYNFVFKRFYIHLACKRHFSDVNMPNIYSCNMTFSVILCFMIKAFFTFSVICHFLAHAVCALCISKQAVCLADCRFCIVISLCVPSGINARPTLLRP